MAIIQGKLISRDKIALGREQIGIEVWLQDIIDPETGRRPENQYKAICHYNVGRGKTASEAGRAAMGALAIDRAGSVGGV